MILRRLSGLGGDGIGRKIGVLQMTTKGPYAFALVPCFPRGTIWQTKRWIIWGKNRRPVARFSNLHWLVRRVKLHERFLRYSSRIGQKAAGSYCDYCGQILAVRDPYLLLVASSPKIKRRDDGETTRAEIVFARAPSKISSANSHTSRCSSIRTSYIWMWCEWPHT